MTAALAKTLTEMVKVFEIYAKTDYLQQLELDSECIHTCFRGSFTPAPTAAAGGAAAQTEEEEEQDEIPVEDLCKMCASSHILEQYKTSCLCLCFSDLVLG